MSSAINERVNEDTSNPHFMIGYCASTARSTSDSMERSYGTCLRLNCGIASISTLFRELSVLDRQSIHEESGGSVDREAARKDLTPSASGHSTYSWRRPLASVSHHTGLLGLARVISKTH